MFDEFIRSYNTFRDRGLEDPLVETLHLFDLLSEGSLNGITASPIEIPDFDVGRIAEARKRGMPLEYILGRAVFMGLTLQCTTNTLIPREETALLVETTLGLIEERGGPEPRLIDVGTGCGNIAIAIALKAQSAKIHATDIDPDAVEVAKRNVDKFGLGQRVFLLCGDLLKPLSLKVLAGKLDIIVCNPPYIPTGSLQKLDPAITEHEPVLALDAGSYGIDIFRRLIKDAPPFLKEDGVLLFEIGAGQEKLVDMLFEKSGAFGNIRHYDDGKDVRVISAERK